MVGVGVESRFRDFACLVPPNKTRGLTMEGRDGGRGRGAGSLVSQSRSRAAEPAERTCREC